MLKMSFENLENFVSPHGSHHIGMVEKVCIGETPMHDNNNGWYGPVYLLKWDHLHVLQGGKRLKEKEWCARIVVVWW